jgi:hypothetical protein
MTPVTVWIATGAVTAAIDGTMLWRRYTGRLGNKVRQECRSVFLHSPVNTVAVVLVRDFVLPPAGWAVCAARYLRDAQAARE